MNQDDELIVLVDEHNNELGTAPKLFSHHANTPLHRAFSCYIFNNEGMFLMTQRALAKKVFPGVWTNSVCGHPAPGESFEEAVQRRAKYELGLTLENIECLIPDFSYTAEMNGVIENEFCPIFRSTVLVDPTPNKDEVHAFTWIDWNEYIARALENPSSLSPWTVLQVRKLQNQI